MSVRKTHTTQKPSTDKDAGVQQPETSTKLDPISFIERRCAELKEELSQELISKELSLIKEEFEEFKQFINNVTFEYDPDEGNRLVEQHRAVIFQATLVTKDDIGIFGKPTSFVSKNIKNLAKAAKDHPFAEKFQKALKDGDSPYELQRGVEQLMSKIKTDISSTIGQAFTEMSEIAIFLSSGISKGFLKLIDETSPIAIFAKEILKDVSLEKKGASVVATTDLNRLEYIVTTMNLTAELVQLLPDIAARELIEPTPSSINLSEYPKIAKRVEKNFPELEQKYRRSNEARSLRLLAVVQNGEGELSSEDYSKAERLVKQLSKLGANGVCKLLQKLSEKVEVTEDDLQAIKKVFDRFTPKTEEKSEEASEDKLEEDGTDTDSNMESNTPTPEKDVEYIDLLLLELGVKDKHVRSDLTKVFDEGQLSVITDLFERNNVSPEFRSAMLGFNPYLIVELSVGPLNRHLKEVVKIYKESHPFRHYKIFNPVLFPEHFSSSENLEKLRTALDYIKGLHKEFAVEEEPEDEEIVATEAHPEQHLIDQLRPYTSNPYLAYNLIRYGLFFQGRYSSARVPEYIRVNQVRPRFDRTPNPKDMRTVEKELISAGFIADCHDKTKATDNLIRLSHMREVKDSTKRELFVLLTDVTTKPSDPPKLPTEYPAD